MEWKEVERRMGIAIRTQPEAFGHVQDQITLGRKQIGMVKPLRCQIFLYKQEIVIIPY